MAALNQNFGMFSGNNLTLTFTVLDGEGAAPDLTGSTATWRMAATPGGSPILSKACTINGPSSDAPSLEVALVPADTESIAAGQYWHEAEITDANGKITTVASGRISMADSLF